MLIHLSFIIVYAVAIPVSWIQDVQYCPVISGRCPGLPKTGECHRTTRAATGSAAGHGISFFLQLVDVVSAKVLLRWFFLELGETQPKSEKNIIVLYYCNYIAIFLSQLLFKLYSYISYNYCYKIILVVQLVIAESMVCGLWLRFCSECSRSLARTGISPDLSTKVGQGIQWSGSNIMAWPGRSMECSAYW